jgi:hypothetical protein
MIRRRFLLTALLIVAIARGAAAPAARAVDALPAQLTDREFWTLIEDLSEPNGTFRSDNLLSNELRYQHVIPDLLRRSVPGRAYVGVGPEQNFTYIAAIKPAIAFVVDIRRGNLNLHLLYKALFELSVDRAELVSLLFSRPRPKGLTARSTAAEIFAAYATVQSEEGLYTQTAAAVRHRLLTVHGFNLGDEDQRGLEHIFRAFFTFGPGIQYSPFGLGGATVQPTYADLMAATDDRGASRGFLSSEEAFAVVKALEHRNLIVPVVGNFAGPKAMRAVGAYLRQHGAIVSAFYVSNVEEYLRRDSMWRDFCDNVSSLPRDEASVFIRSSRAPTGNPRDGMTSELGPITEISNCRD